MKKLSIVTASIFCLFTLFLLPQTKIDKKELTLKEAIFHALKNNLDLQIQVINAENSLNSLRIDKAIFIPTFNATFNTQETNNPTSDIFSGADIRQNKSLSLNLSLSQKLALGGTFSVELNNFRSESNNIYSTVNPYLSSTLTFRLSQPLLKGFGSLVTKRGIYIALNNLEKSRFQLQQRILDLIYDVENSYWNLVYAYQNLDTRKMSLQRSQDLLKQNRIKVKVGAAAPIDILDAEASVASDESNLLQAEQQIQTAEDNLKKILNLSKLEQTIVPVDVPETKKIDVDFNAFLMEALGKRPDIQQVRLDLKNYKIDVRYARNQMLPDLQLTASYWTTGRGGDQLIFDNDSLFGPREVIGVIEKTIWESMKETISNQYKNFSVGLQLNLPLSFSKEKAQLAQAKLNLKAALLGLKNTENNIYAEINQAIKTLESNEKVVKAMEISLDLEQRKLKAEEKKLSVGLVSNYDVIIKQRDLVQAQTSHLQALKDYLMTIADINRKLARTFEIYGITFDDYVKTK